MDLRDIPPTDNAQDLRNIAQQRDFNAGVTDALGDERFLGGIFRWNNERRLQRCNNGGYTSMMRDYCDGVRYATDNVRDAEADAAALRTVLGRQVQGMLSSLQPYARFFNRDADGVLELHEVCNTLKALGITRLTDRDRDGDIDKRDLAIARDEAIRNRGR